MKKSKLIKKFSIILGLILLFTSCLSVNAHEITPGPYRWGDTRYSNGVRHCYLLTNADYLSSINSARYQSAISHWNSFSNNKVVMIDTAFGSSKVDFVTPNASIWEQYFDDATAAITCAKNEAGQYPFNNPYGSSGFNSGIIVSAQILVNPSTVTYSTMFKQDYLIRHELGHVMGLGHPPTNVVSLMYPYINSAPYNTVQTHDISDLNLFYPN